MPRPRKSTMIRNERKATASRKRAAFEFQAPIKKTGIAPGFYNSGATGNPCKAPAAKPNTPRYGA
ncbi:MAG: hypothetical protein LAE24_00175 [Candidatus Contendobacter sp.]|nr:hypothetical protein [Candidatus Contendobacter sp.]